MDSAFKVWFYSGPTRHFGHNEGKRGKGKNGTKKYGRNREVCARYRAEGRRAANRARRIARHVRHHPNDAAARFLIETDR